MKLHKCDKCKCGIYKIINTTNNKVYVGKAKDIYNRMMQHRCNLRRKCKDENIHLINAWHKYGEDSFIYEVIEELELNENLLKEREDYWIVKLKATDHNFGYNMRRDSSTRCIMPEESILRMSESMKGEKNPNYGNKWSDEQKQRMSEIKKEQYRTGEVKPNLEAIRKGISVRNQHWNENPKLKEQMKQKVSSQTTEYNFYQYDKKTGELVKVWNSIYDILLEHPEWKRHNIYAACSGEKPSIYGYKWKKVLKNDIVQPSMKVDE